ncbi:MAG TPA: hypothetical protein VF647_08275 [Longimicrobium sp.]|jgi:hypothetical protein
MRYFRLTLAALAAAAACGANPAATMQPHAPRYDGGGMVGSGNVSDTTTVNSSNLNTTELSDTMAAAAPGGGMVGSGN